MAKPEAKLEPPSPALSRGWVRFPVAFLGSHSTPLWVLWLKAAPYSVWKLDSPSPCHNHGCSDETGYNQRALNKSEPSRPPGEDAASPSELWPFTLHLLQLDCRHSFKAIPQWLIHHFLPPLPLYPLTYQEMVWTWSQSWVHWEFSGPGAEASHWTSYTCIGTKTNCDCSSFIIIFFISVACEPR